MLDAFKKRRAKAQNEEGGHLLDKGDLAGAQAAFERTLELDPTLPWGWFNLALVHKRNRNWPEVVRCNRHVVELTGTSKDEPAWWNLGIAATALRDWDAARAAWVAYGVPLSEGRGPINENFGLAPVRVDPEGNPEVVWGTRIDPARAVIRSVPLPDSGRRWGDCILHDGVPNGERMLGGQRRAVFDEIEVWESSGVPTMAAVVECASEEDSTELTQLFLKADRGAEDWSGDVRMLCRACSEGLVDLPHDHSRNEEWSPERRFGLAATEEEATRLAEQWLSAAPSRRGIRSIERAL